MPEKTDLTIKEEEFFSSPAVPDSFKKAVGVVQVAMGELGLLHRKCYNIALANAYEGLGQGNLKFRMPVSLVADWAQFDSHNYQALYDVFEELRKTQVRSITFDTTLVKKGRARRKIGSDGLLAGFSLIEGGIIEYSFTEDMAKILYEPDQYIWMSLTVQNRFSSKYELNLFENIVRYQRTGSTGFKAVKDWRELLGATEDTYQQFKRFNDLVLKPAVKGVNEKSGLLVEPEFRREKRKISEIRFAVKENPQMELLNYRQHSAIRKTETYKKLLSFKLSDTVAVYWIETKGERYVTEAIEYTEAKKPEKNFAGYLVRTLEQGFGEKTKVERDAEAKEAEAVKENLKKQELRRKVFCLALEYRVIERRFQDQQREQGKRLIERLKGEVDQDALKLDFEQRLEGKDIQLRDFRKKSWDSLLNLSEVRAFAANKFDEAVAIIDEHFKAENSDFERLSKANAEISSSFLISKLEEAASYASNLPNPDFGQITRKFT